MTYTLITGASGGIGYELAKTFAKHGHNLILVARNEKSLINLKKNLETKYHISAIVIAQDLSEKDAAKQLHHETVSCGYVVDNLVNNAGFGDWGAFLDSDWKRQYEMVQLNITSLMQMTYLYGNDMKKLGGGHILNLSSVAAFSAGPYMSIYYATKGYVLSFSEAVGEELKGTGVTVTALCPGPTSTGFEKTAKMEQSKMFQLFRPASAKAVANCGYDDMQRGKMVAYHSFATKAMNVGSRFMPRSRARKFAKDINSQPTHSKQ